MNPETFKSWLNDQPTDLPLGDRTWLNNPLANYCHDNQLKTLPMPAWGLRFVNAIQSGRPLNRHHCLCALALAALTPVAQTPQPELVGVA